MDLNALKPLLDQELNKPFIARALMDGYRLVNESDRKAPSYADPKFVPFYYHLGKHLKPKRVVEINLGLGLFSASFFKSCKDTVEFLALQEQGKEFYSARMGRKNVQSNFKGEIHIHVGDVLDNEFTEIFLPKMWDLALISVETGFDKHMLYLDFVWPQISHDGVIVMDFLTKHTPGREAFLAFCKGHNKEPVLFETRYGVGIVQK